MFTKCSFGHQRLAALLNQLRHCSSNSKLTQSQVFKQQRLEKLRKIEKYPHYFAIACLFSLFAFDHNSNWKQKMTTHQFAHNHVLPYDIIVQKCKIIPLDNSQ